MTARKEQTIAETYRTARGIGGEQGSEILISLLNSLQKIHPQLCEQVKATKDKHQLAGKTVSELRELKKEDLELLLYY